MAACGTGLAARETPQEDELSEPKTFTAEINGRLISVTLRSLGDEIEITARTQAGLSLSETFDPTKKFYLQKVRRWPMQPMGTSHSFAELEKQTG